VGVSRKPKQRPWSWERHQWAQPVSDDIAARRAGGRRRRNADQQLARAVRRYRVEQMMVETWPALMTDRGWQAETARALGVDRATVCRDVDAILEPLGITYRLIRALMPRAAETRLFARLGLPGGWPGDSLRSGQ
jgi:hypothetical protein